MFKVSCRTARYFIMCAYMCLHDNQLNADCMQGPALMEMFGWLTETRLPKGEWSSATMEYGELCVMTAGAETMHWWCADS